MEAAEIGGAVAASLFDANTVLAANADNTPAPVTMAEQTVLGRLIGGNIKAVTLDELGAPNSVNAMEIIAY